MNRLTVTVHPPNRQSFTLVVDKRIELGRESEGVILVDSRVSRRHVAIEPGVPGTVLVTDLGSSNGTTLDDLPLDKPTEAATGSIIRLGDTRVEVGAMPAVGLQSPLLPVDGTELVAQHGSGRSSIEGLADAVVDDLRADVLDVDNEPGTLTIVFSDIEESTQLAVSLGDAVWYDVLQRHGRLFEAHVGAHGGRIVKNQGDGYMLCFRSARSALLAAIGVQRDLATTHWSPPGQELRVRMGVHLGEVLVDDAGDLFGKHVVIAARIGALAQGAEILVSSLVRQIVEPRGDFSLVAPRSVELRGIGGTETVWSLDWRNYRPGSVPE